MSREMSDESSSGLYGRERQARSEEIETEKEGQGGRGTGGYGVCVWEWIVEADEYGFFFCHAEYQYELFGGEGSLTDKDFDDLLDTNWRTHATYFRGSSSREIRPVTDFQSGPYLAVLIIQRRRKHCSKGKSPLRLRRHFRGRTLRQTIRYDHCP